MSKFKFTDVPYTVEFDNGYIAVLSTSQSCEVLPRKTVFPGFYGVYISYYSKSFDDGRRYYFCKFGGISYV